MKFTVNLSEFQKVLQKVLPAVPPKSTVPVLEHIFMKLENSKLQLIATDQNLTILSSINVDSESHGKILVPARKLNDIIKALGNAGSIQFETNLENFEVKIVTNKGSYDIKGLDPEDYIEIPQLFDNNPDFEEPEGVVSSLNNRAELTKDQIINLSEKVAFCVSMDQYRVAMTGVFFQFRETYVCSVATDSYRLSRYTVTSDRPIFPQNFDLLLSVKAVDILRKADADVVMTTIENYGKVTHARFDSGDTTFITRVINEKYPPYESVLPRANHLKLTADIDEFVSALKRVSIFANEKSKQIRFTISPNNLVMYAEDDETGNHGEETVSCEFNADDFKLIFNYKYLIDALEHINSNETEDNAFVMTFSEPSKASLITPKNDKNEILMLVMPVRISSL